jgi:hypothetical protein
MPDRYEEELDRLRSIDVPDQWDDVSRRAPVGPVQPSEPGGRRARWPILVATAAILVLVAGSRRSCCGTTRTSRRPSHQAPGAPLGAPPYFCSAPDWETVQTGSSAIAGKRRSTQSVTARQWTRVIAVAADATLKDLMKASRYASAAAANRYLDAVDGRDAEIAAALSELATSGDAAKLPRSIVR